MNQTADRPARVSLGVQASAQKVWKALVEPETIRKYMMGTNVVTDWQEGNEISWEGEWEGKAYKDKGTSLKNEPERLLRYTHFSPLTGEPDIPENYHTVTVELASEGSGTRVTLTQDNNETEKARADSEKNWTAMLEGLEEIVETS